MLVKCPGLYCYKGRDGRTISASRRAPPRGDGNGTGFRAPAVSGGGRQLKGQPEAFPQSVTVSVAATPALCSPLLQMRVLVSRSSSIQASVSYRRREFKGHGGSEDRTHGECQAYRAWHRHAVHTKMVTWKCMCAHRRLKGNSANRP